MDLNLKLKNISEKNSLVSCNSSLDRYSPRTCWIEAIRSSKLEPFARIYSWPIFFRYEKAGNMLVQ